LIDFGAVKQVTAGGINGRTVTIGTPGYMPTEQINGYPNQSSDVYAVGMLAIQAITGSPPHQLPRDANTDEIIWRNQARVSSSLAEILDKMVCYHSSQRYPEASEALQAVRSLTQIAIASLPPSSPTPPPTLNTTPKPQSANVWTYTIVATIGLCFVIVYGIFSISKVRDQLGFDSQPSPPSRTTVADNLLTYKNYSNGISINYPNDWNMEEKPNQFTGTFVKFIPRDPSIAGSCKSDISLSVEPVTPDYNTLDKYTQSTLDFIKKSRTIDESSQTSLDARNAHKVVYTSKPGGLNCKWMEVWTIINERVYVINYQAAPSQHANFSETINQIINSFKFLTD